MSASPLLQVRDLVVHYPLPRGLVGTLGRREERVVRAVDGISLNGEHGSRTSRAVDNQLGIEFE